jgi:hypothetical protein
LSSRTEEVSNCDAPSSSRKVSLDKCLISP